MNESTVEKPQLDPTHSSASHEPTHLNQAEPNPNPISPETTLEDETQEHQNQAAQDAQDTPALEPVASQEVSALDAQSISSDDDPQAQVSQPIEQAQMAISASLQQITEQLAQLQGEFERKIKWDAGKQETIDNLHKEVLSYRNGLIEKQLRPVYMSLIQMADDYRKLLEVHTQTPVEELDAPKLLKQMKQIPADLDDLLYGQEVEPFTEETNSFNPQRQKNLKAIPTSDQSKHRLIAKRLQPGYQWREDLLRRELVQVFTFQEENSQEDHSE